MLEIYKDLKAKNFDKLMESIDFFTQNLSFEQVVTYGYTFIHNILELKESAIYVYQDRSFELGNQIECSFTQQEFYCNKKLMEIATHFGRVIQKELPLYFDMEFIKKEEITLALPIIVKDSLVGIIFSKNVDIDLNNSEISLFFNAINQLVNKAAESAKRFDHFKTINSELDRKIFNLLFINHSTKALMTELDTDKLYNLCVEVIRELTSSSVTSFGLFDITRDKVVLKGFSDILSFDMYYTELTICSDKKKISKTIYHIDNDYDELKSIFENAEEFISLKAEYVILIVQEKILGFVTIGKPVSGKEYTAELLSQIESLVSSIYIAIKNAQYFMTINEQRKEANIQIELLAQLGNAIKNINSCSDVDELCRISLQTLKIGFGIDKAMIVLNSKDGFFIQDKVGFDTNNCNIVLSNKFRSNCFNSICYDELSNSSYKYFDLDFLEQVGESNCYMSVPLEIDEISSGNESLGFLIVFNSEESLKKRKKIVIEALANSITPILKQMNEKNDIKKHYLPDEEKLFVKSLIEAINNRESFYTDFTVFYKKVIKRPFEALVIHEYNSIETFYFSNIIFHIAYDNCFDYRLFDGNIEVSDLSDFLNEVKLIM